MNVSGPQQSPSWLRPLVAGSYFILGLALFAPHAFAHSIPAGEERPITWEKLEEGLELASIELPQKSKSGDSLAMVVRADPSHFGLRLLNASADPEGVQRTAREWALHADLVAVTNAAMYQEDHRTSVSLMRAPGHVNNGHLTKDRTLLAFDPIKAGVPAIQIVDLDCQSFAAIEPSYGSLVQSIRMISCRRHNVWAQQDKAWSTSALAIDGAGRVLVIHVRSPYSTHDLIDNLLALPLDIRNAMYLEGGRPAQLFLRSGGREVEVVGSTGSAGVGGNRTAIAFPNALGLYRLKKP